MAQTMHMLFIRDGRGLATVSIKYQMGAHSWSLWPRRSWAVAQALLSRWAWVSYMVKGYEDRQVSPLSPFASVFRLYSSTLYYDVGGFEMPTDDPNPGGTALLTKSR